MANGKYFGGGGPVQPYKKINDSIGPTDRDRIRTDHYGEPIRWKDKPVQRKNRSWNASVLSMVSIILVIGLIATVFVAYQNSISEGDSILYFSPANYLSRLSNPVVSSSGSYPLYYDKYNGVGTSILEGYYAFILIGGQKYNSENYVSYFDLGQSSTTFVFVINGERVSSRIASDDDPIADGSIGIGNMFPMPSRVVDLKGGDVGNLTLPDISVVGEAWSSVGGVDFVNDIARAFSVTGDFIVSSVNYEIGIIGKLLPWNFFVDGNSSDVGMPRDYLPDLWEKAEETWKENAE